MNSTEPAAAYQSKPTITDLQRSFLRRLLYTLVKDKYSATRADLYLALSYDMRDMLVERWQDTRQSCRWVRTSTLDSAGMGKFSSDRTIAEYAREIWGISPEKVSRHSRRDLQ
jgi:glucan phosphorylase